MIVAGQEIGGTRAWVLAEIGSNHCGDLNLAERMVRVAAACGADAVKLQKRDLKTLYTTEFYNSPYNSEAAYGNTYGTHREALEFGRDEYLRLKEVAEDSGVTLFATAFDKPSVDFCVDIGLPAIKIASGDLTNLDLIFHAASTGLPIFLSTGGGTMADVEKAVETIGAYDQNFCLMQCTASYPSAYDILDLNVIRTFKQTFPQLVIGASLHDNGIAMAVLAYALGARVIEKHVTLDRTMRGTDHAFSLEPQGLEKLVRDLRRAEVATGDGVKKYHQAELGPISKMGKSLYSTKALPAGHVIQREDVTLKSPGNGLPPLMPEQVIGRVLNRTLDREELIEYADVEAHELSA